MGKKNEANNAEQLSNSMKKRIDRANQNKKAKRDAILSKIAWYLILALIVAAIGYIVTLAAIKASYKVTADNNYSGCLDDNGYIKGVTASTCVTIPEYKGINIPKSEIVYTDEEINAAIDTQLSSHKTLDTESDAVIADGDEINLDYVGTIDGEEFEGGNSNGAGHDLTIGSGAFVDDFEQQLIGAGIGDTLTVNVTFPEDYATAEIAGKDAEFDCVINGIYTVPEFDDAFVQEYLSDKASTAEEYKQYLKDTHEDENMTNWIKDYLDTNTTVNTYPRKYLKQLKALEKYTSMESFEYINQIYASMYGQGYSDFYEYEQTTEEEYDKNLIESGKATEKTNMIYQAIMEKEGIKLTIDDYKNSQSAEDSESASVETQIDEFGVPYLVQSLYPNKAIEIIKDNATITE